MPAGSWRILHVVDSLEQGGLERVVCDLAQAQKSAGHHVCVFSIQSTQGFKASLLQAGIAVLEGHKRDGLDLRVLWRLRNWIRQQHIDVVHAHNFVPNYHAALAMLGWRTRPALVCTCHDMGTRLSNPRLRWLFTGSLRHTAQVAMVGEQVYRAFVDKGWVKESKARSVRNGIPLQRFTSHAWPNSFQEARHTARQALGLSSQDTVIGCVGRLVPIKNHSAMVRAMPELLAQQPDLHLVLVGAGPLASDLSQQAAQTDVGHRVHLVGAHDDVASLLPAFDVFALPSQSEGLSIALLEACATGLAVLATEVGGNPEVIQHGVTGWLIPSGDDEALAHALAHLLSHPTLRQSLGEAARLWVEQHGSIEALRQAYDACYADALRG